MKIKFNFILFIVFTFGLNFSLYGQISIGNEQKVDKIDKSKKSRNSSDKTLSLSFQYSSPSDQTKYEYELFLSGIINADEVSRFALNEAIGLKVAYFINNKVGLYIKPLVDLGGIGDEISPFAGFFVGMDLPVVDFFSIDLGVGYRNLYQENYYTEDFNNDFFSERVTEKYTSLAFETNFNFYLGKKFILSIGLNYIPYSIDEEFDRALIYNYNPSDWHSDVRSGISYDNFSQLNVQVGVGWAF